MSSDRPVDPKTGRAMLGGRARRAADAWRTERLNGLIAVELPHGYVVHLLDMSDPYQPTLCCRSTDRCAPATSSWRRLCEVCARRRERVLA
jgi:hypothetical protein